MWYNKSLKQHQSQPHPCRILLIHTSWRSRIRHQYQGRDGARPLQIENTAKLRILSLAGEQNETSHNEISGHFRTFSDIPPICLQNPSSNPRILFIKVPTTPQNSRHFRTFSDIHPIEHSNPIKQILKSYPSRFRQKNTLRLDAPDGVHTQGE